ncbi:hypothetical protein K3495_g10496 [Podosphaera aphanis]|nr:hypothetical protein K3495_g10496 [Podosphaera aphanis]
MASLSSKPASINSSLSSASTRRSNEDYTRYFIGPRDLDAHSKLPLFLRVHGSVLPRMVIPVILIGLWATLITAFSEIYYDLSVEPLLITVLGIVVGLSLSFRSSTAYERYSEGRRAWTTLMVATRNMARIIWVQVPERESTAEQPDLAESDLLLKISAINLLATFATALKHKLRFEPYVYYDDLESQIASLETWAKSAQESQEPVPEKKSSLKTFGEYLSLKMALSNPRKVIKRANAPLGNVPLEILDHIAAVIHEMGNFNPGPSFVSAPVYQQMMNTMIILEDVNGQTERILNTPLPVGYNILISQAVLLYTYLLPFQLHPKLGWATIPFTLAAAYIMIGLATIGQELENPFGNDVNDLPLDKYCDEIRSNLDILMSKDPEKYLDFIFHEDHKPLWPLSSGSYGMWLKRDAKSIRNALRSKVVTGSRQR